MIPPIGFDAGRSLVELVGRLEGRVALLAALLDLADLRGTGRGVTPQINAMKRQRLVLLRLVRSGEVLDAEQRLGTTLLVHRRRVRSDGRRPHEELPAGRVRDRDHALHDQLPGRTDAAVLVEDAELRHVPRVAEVEPGRDVTRLLEPREELLDCLRRLVERQRTAEADELAPVRGVHDESVAVVHVENCRGLLIGVVLVVGRTCERLLVGGHESLSVEGGGHCAPAPVSVCQRTTSISLLRTIPSSLMSAEMVIPDG